MVGSIALSSPATAEPYTHPINLPANLNGTTGVELLGADNAMTGYTVSGAGDVNGDGLSDVLIGAPQQPGGGAAYVVFGQTSTWPSRRTLPDLNGADGFMIVGNPLGYMGESVAMAGDVNNDGFDDVLVGEFEDSRVYIIYGSANPFPPVFDVINPPGSHAVTTLEGKAGSSIGARAAAAGDVNGDSFGDVIVGSSTYEPNGRGVVHVVFGSSSLGNMVSLEGLNGTNGFAVRSDQARASNDGISGVGDVNGDGFGDIAIGSNSYYGLTNTGGAGVVDVVFGKASGFPAVMYNTDLATTGGFRFYGNYMNDNIGYAISAGGDINGDGIGDMLAGSYYYSSGYPNGFERGVTYVLYGQTKGLTGLIPSSLLNGRNGYGIRGIANDDRMGFSASPAGDFNGDGLWDQLTGGSNNGIYGSYTGQCFMTHGGSGQDGSPWYELSSVDGTNGFRMNPAARYDELGTSLAHAGDANGDGYSDLIIGAPYAHPAGTMWPGAAYMVFGSAGSTTGTYRAVAAAGNASKIGIGGSGLTSSAIPASRAWIDYQDGSASTETVTLVRSKETIADLERNQVANVLWQISTTRTGWTTAEVTFQYTDSEVAPYEESQLLLYKSASADGPWTVVNSTVDPETNRISGQVNDFSFFAIATSSIPVTLSHFSLE